MKLTIATRNSPLALAQTEIVANRLRAQHQELSIDLLPISTKADRFLNVALTKIGGKGLFVKELEEALLAGDADIAVHSMKDVPMDLPPGLALPVILPRADARDVLLAPGYANLQSLPHAATLATSSLRRQSQLLALRPDLKIFQLRGNVNSRLVRLAQGEFSSMVLAAAGLLRLQTTEQISAYLSPDELLPAAGQGALGIECRTADTQTQQLIAPLNDPAAQNCVEAERAICRQLQGGCLMPIGAYAVGEQQELHLRGLVANKDGTVILKAEARGTFAEPQKLGQQVANLLIAQGAKELLAAFEL